MGYNLYITRKENWFDQDGDDTDDVSPEEWLAYIATDRSLKLDDEAEAARDRGTAASELGNLDARWLGWNPKGPQTLEVPIWYDDGNLVSKNPSTDMVRKMFLIADELNARLVGEEGEEYDSTGEVAGQAPTGKLGKKKWWKFW